MLHLGQIYWLPGGFEFEADIVQMDPDNIQGELGSPSIYKLYRESELAPFGEGIIGNLYLLRAGRQ
jgi:hypothetical protein